MNFASPALAGAAVAAMTLPILIHLLMRRRQRPVEWAAMELLRRAIQKHRRSRRIERWILLVMRCLLLLLAGLAMARPLASSVLGAGQPTALALVIDDSAASRATAADGRSAFTMSQGQAQEAIDALPAGSSVVVVRTSSGAALTPQPTPPASAAALVAAMEPTFEPGRLRDAVASADELLRSSPLPGRILVTSSFTRGAVDTEATVLPSTRAVLTTLQTADVAEDNASIVGVKERTLGPSDGSTQSIEVTLARTGNDDEHEVVVTLKDVEQDRALTNTTLFAKGEQQATTTFTVPSTISTEHCFVATIPDDAQPADNTRATCTGSSNDAEVMVVDRERLDTDEGSSATWVGRALEPIPGVGFSREHIDPAQVGSMTPTEARTIIVCRPELLDADGWASLLAAVDHGAHLVLMPPADDTFTDWQTPCAAALGEGVTIGREAATFNPPTHLAARQPASTMTQLLASELTDLVTPVEVDRSTTIDAPPGRLLVSLECDDHTPFLVSGFRGRGLVTMLAVAPVPAWSSLPTKPLFVPLIQEVVRQGRVMLDESQALTIGDVRVSDGATELRPIMTAQSAPTLTLDADGRVVSDGISPGVYDAISPTATHRVAVDVLTQACDPSHNDSARLAAWLNQAAAPDTAVNGMTTVKQEGDSPLAPILLAIAGLCVLVETLLGRSFSVPEPARA